MLSAVFEPAIPASERPQNHALGRAAARIGRTEYWCYNWADTSGPRLTAEWSIGERCPACRHVKRSEWQADASCRINLHTAGVRRHNEKRRCPAMFRTHSTSRRISFAWPYHLACTLVRNHAIFYNSTWVLQSMPVFWDVALCRVRSSQRFEVFYFLIFHGHAVQE